MSPEEIKKRLAEIQRPAVEEDNSIETAHENTIFEDVMRKVESPRRTIAINSNFLAWLDRSSPSINVMSHEGGVRGEISCFESWLVDFCFVSTELNIIVSLETNATVWIHCLTVQHGKVVGSVLGQLAFPHDSSLFGVGVSTRTPHFQEDFADGYLVVGGHELIAVQIASVITENGPIDLYDVPRVNFGECQELFAICPEGIRLASCNGATVSVFMLPSSAAHMTFTPHGRQEIADIAFGPSSTKIITLSNGDNYIHIWDISNVEPHCKHSIRLPPQKYHWASKNAERLLLHSFGSKNVLDVDTTRLSIREFQIEEKLTNFNFFGWCLSSRKNKDFLCIRLESKLVTYELPKSGDTTFHSTATSEIPISEPAAEIRYKSLRPHPDSNASDFSDICEREQLKDNAAMQLQTSSKLCSVFQDATSERRNRQASENEELRECMSHCSLEALENCIDAVTKAIIRTSQRVSNYHKSSLQLEARIESLPSQCGKLVKNHLKDRADHCISLLEPAIDGIHVEPGRTVDSKTLCTQVATVPTKFINECLSTYEEKVAQCAHQPHKDFDAEIHGLLRKICKKLFPSAELGEYARQIEEIENNAIVTQSSRSAILSQLQLDHYEQALEVALQSNSTEVLVWLLTEASSIQTWSELVVDEKLSPLNTLSLTFSTCVALSLGSCVYPASISESLILLVRDTVVMYKKRWSEAINSRIYNSIRVHCLNLTHSMLKGNTRGPLYSSINETIRVLQA